MEKIDLPLGGRLLFSPRWLAASEASHIQRELERELQPCQEEIMMFGRPCKQARLTQWMGDPRAVYRYGGREFVPAPWTPTMLAIKARVERAVGHAFNSVLVNLYRDGRDSVAMHADNEKPLAPVIASMSFGATRRLVLQTKCDEDNGVPNRELARFRTPRPSIMAI